MKILIAGDYCPKNRIAQIIEEGRFEDAFRQVSSLTKGCDYSIVNLECPINSSGENGIKKAGPSLKCSPKAVDAIKYAGFDCVTLANNHFYDQGDQGVNETIETLKKAKLEYVGGGYNIEEAGRTLYKTIGDKSLAVINCCEHEFSIATQTTGGSNPLNPIHQYYAIKEAKDKVDYVLVIVHGGIENFQYPTPRMKETYRFFIEAGAYAVVNHHQHCFSGYEVYNGKPIFYGLGNFCFDWAERSTLLWEEGFVVTIDFSKAGIEYQFYPYQQNGKIPGVFFKEGDAYEEWWARFLDISNIISIDEQLRGKYEQLLIKGDRAYSANLTPYSFRLSLSLYMKHLLPLLFPKKKLRLLLNMMVCESHYERMIHMLKKYSE